MCTFRGHFWLKYKEGKVSVCEFYSYMVAELGDWATGNPSEEATGKIGRGR